VLFIETDHTCKLSILLSSFVTVYSNYEVSLFTVLAGGEGVTWYLLWHPGCSG